MDGSFTVFHDGHYWVGVLALTCDDGVRAARHIFGAKPTNAELLAFAGREFDELARRAHAAQGGAGTAGRLLGTQARARARRGGGVPAATCAGEGQGTSPRQGVSRYFASRALAAPGWSFTGAVSEATIRHSSAIASMEDQDRTNGYVM